MSPANENNILEPVEDSIVVARNVVTIVLSYIISILLHGEFYFPNNQSAIRRIGFLIDPLEEILPESVDYTEPSVPSSEQFNAGDITYSINGDDGFRLDMRYNTTERYIYIRQVPVQNADESEEHNGIEMEE